MSLQLRLRDITLPQGEDFTNMSSQDMPLENRVKLLIIRDLLNLNWKVGVAGEKIEIAPPDFYDKETIRQTMSVKRLEIIRENRNWINNHLDLARSNLAKGSDVLLSRIDPVFEVCETEKQHKIFRIFRYYRRLLNRLGG